MGASPACLNTVGLSSEHKAMVTFSNPESTLVTLNQKGSLALAFKKSVKSYQRYLDDTKTFCESKDIDDIKNNILSIISLFPKSIPINLECSHFLSVFLDVVFLRQSSTDTILTSMKRNMGAPPGFVPSQSVAPLKFKLSGLYGDILRIRRICSIPDFVHLHDKFLIREYKTLGYQGVQQYFDKRVAEIAENYDDSFKRVAEKEVPEGLVFGATTRMEGISQTHIVVKEIIKRSLGPVDARLPMLVPATRLGELLHTRRRYFKKLRAGQDQCCSPK